MSGFFIHLIDQDLAKKIGLALFFEGKKCVHGNYYLRRVRDRRCTCAECRSVKAKYEKSRKLNTPEQREKRASYSKDYRKRNKIEVMQKNKDYLLVQKQINSPVYERYKERARIKNKKNKTENPHKYSAYAATARIKAKYPNSVPSDYGELDLFVLQQAYELKALRTNQTGVEWSVDHMIPLSRGGFHKWNNIQLIPHKLNLLKKFRLLITTPYEWLAYSF